MAATTMLYAGTTQADDVDPAGGPLPGSPVTTTYAYLPFVHWNEPVSFTLFLPAVGISPPWSNPVGVETNLGAMQNPAIFQNARRLGGSWLRLSALSWRSVEPDPPAHGVHTYNWAALANVERDILAANRAGLTVVLGVKDSPAWATINGYACGQIREDRMGDFAAFMQALVERYKADPYRVQYWELGNEPDIDPSLGVGPDAGFGCWGVISDPYYGGGQYGKMLNAVTPAIRAADPGAKVVIGGLLLDSPNTTQPGKGKPEKYLEGILRTPGAAANFDILAYHAYAHYVPSVADQDYEAGDWQALGGRVLGKAKYLRDLMSLYGVDKPLHLNEVGLICTGCDPTPPEFFESQADNAVRFYTRAISTGVEMVAWFTLNGPGWRDGGMLDASQNPRPAYTATQTFIARIRNSGPARQIADYGSVFEAYRFPKSNQAVDVVFSRDTAVRRIYIPATEFVAAYDRSGRFITPVISGLFMAVDVGFSPVYVLRRAP